MLLVTLRNWVRVSPAQTLAVLREIILLNTLNNSELANLGGGRGKHIIQKKT